MQRRRGLVVGIIALAVFTLGYELIQSGGLMETSAFFVGLPALLAIVVTLGASPSSAIGIVLKTLTIAILLSAFVLKACVICLLFAAPLFYVAAILVVALARGAELLVQRGRSLFCVALLPIVLVGGATRITASPLDRVTVSRVVAASPSAVEQALTASPRLDLPRPLLLHRVGYRAEGAGLGVGSLRAITIAIPGEGEGLLTLRVARRGAGVAVFEVVHDGSPVAQWVELRSATVRWVAQGRGTRVDWTFRYARLVGPGWYFGPILQFEARLAAGYLIDSVATPR